MFHTLSVNTLQIIVALPDSSITVCRLIVFGRFCTIDFESLQPCSGVYILAQTSLFIVVVAVVQTMTVSPLLLFEESNRSIAAVELTNNADESKTFFGVSSPDGTGSGSVEPPPPPPQPVRNKTNKQKIAVLEIYAESISITLR